MEEKVTPGLGSGALREALRVAHLYILRNDRWSEPVLCRACLKSAMLAKDIPHVEGCLYVRIEELLSLSSPIEPGLSAILEHDRTKVAECVTRIKDELQSYSWLIDSRGSYEWDDDKWHREFAEACDAIAFALGPMIRIAADWSTILRRLPRLYVGNLWH